jgi:hypothetical protein
VDLQLRRQFLCETRQPDVLDDQCVNASPVQEPELGFGGIEFAGEDQRVESRLSPETVIVAECNQPRQILLREIIRAQTGVETGEPEIDGIRPVGRRRPDAIPVSGGGEQFRKFAHWQTHYHPAPTLPNSDERRI